MYVASNHALQINRRKVTASDRRQKRATFHETWEEAHAAQVEKARVRLEDAGRKLKFATQVALSAAKALKKAEAMTKPEDA
jgi:1,6-anhydro-N-acetylmuramate kinase